MKKLLTAMFVALLMGGCGEEAQKEVVEGRAEEERKRVEEFNRKYGKIILNAIDFDEKPADYTGWAKMIHDNGQIRSLIQLKDGKRHGPFTEWHKNGQKVWEMTFKDNKLDTLVVWKPNGEKCPDTNLVDGNGVVFSYQEDGTEGDRLTFKDGKPVFD